MTDEHDAYRRWRDSVDVPGSVVLTDADKKALVEARRRGATKEELHLMLHAIYQRHEASKRHMPDTKPQ